MSAAVEAPKVRLELDALHIEFPSLFGPGGGAQARRFARRVFAFPQVLGLDLHPDPGKAAVRFQVDEAGRKAFIGQLAAALGGSEDGVDEAQLPQWSANAPVGLHRFNNMVSTFEATQASPGRLQLRHAAISRDAALARRLEDTAKNSPGVKQATATGSAGRLWIAYQEGAVDVFALIRSLEQQLAAPRTALAATDIGQPTKMALANATLGLAALGEFAVPVVLPVCVGMLVATNLGTIKDAGKQLSQGKVGLPVLYTALLGCSITTGQIVAHALMDWSFRFWAKRSCGVLAEECRTLLEDKLPIPSQARLVRSDEVDALVDSNTLQAGDRIRLEAPAAVPIDGRVLEGYALVEQASLGGGGLPRKVAFGDEILAGSTLLAGQIEVEVLKTSANTQAARIAHSVIASARDLAQDPILRRQAEALADRPVPATLAIAGAGWLVGGLFTVGAVLHQDHATGPKLAVPLQTLRDIRLALGNGVVVRRGGALPRLSESRFLVLDDHPAWSSPILELEAVHSRLAESETDKLLRYAAGAGLYLGDERSQALIDACQARGLVVRQPPLVALDADQLSVRQGEHLLSLREAPGSLKQSLKIEIDGEDLALLDFRRGPVPRAALAVQRLRRQGKQVFLLSSQPAAEAQQLASLLGADLHGGDFSPMEKQRFLEGLRRRGVLATYVGNARLDPALAGSAHVAVSLGGLPCPDEEAADLVVLGDSLGALAEVDALASGHHQRIQAACRNAWVPNLLCIVGGYAGVLNGITSGLIANLGVSNVYRQATRSLRALS